MEMQPFLNAARRKLATKVAGCRAEAGDGACRWTAAMTSEAWRDQDDRE